MSISEDLEGLSPEERVRERARIAAEFWDNYPGRNTRGTAKFKMPEGSVEIGKVEFFEENGVVAIHVWTGNNTRQSPQYRIVNPPMLVEDPQGDVEVTMKDKNGNPVKKKFKEDPVKAIAASITNSRSRGRR